MSAPNVPAWMTRRGPEGPMSKGGQDAIGQYRGQRLDQPERGLWRCLDPHRDPGLLDLGCRTIREAGAWTGLVSSLMGTSSPSGPST